MLNINRQSAYQTLLRLGLGIGFAMGLVANLTPGASAAEYRGQRLDGRSFEAIVMAESKGQKEARITFKGYQALVHFREGGYVIVELDSVIIRDRENIRARDRRQNTEWQIALK
ncbi:MAG: hypothetical protein HC824_19145 [Synechococcales cyanobacterium RM1_1_8]|nr:hypothetical protein [Synechococcales cyanobacterium RM1_1_8]